MTAKNRDKKERNQKKLASMREREKRKKKRKRKKGTMMSYEASM